MHNQTVYELPLDCKGKPQISGKTEDGQKIIPVIKVYGKSDGAVCSGCGGMISSNKGLQYKEGIVSSVVSVSKSRAHRLKGRAFLKNATTALCVRCKALAHLKDTTTSTIVDKLSVVHSSPVSTSIFEVNVAKIKHHKAWVIHVVDATDFESTIIRAVRDFIGSNPLILAVTKSDLLPVDLKDEYTEMQLKNYFKARCRQKGLNCHEVFLVSGLHSTGIGDIVDFVLQHIDGKDVYVFGYTNTGKSTLVNSFVKRALESKVKFKGYLARRRQSLLATTSVTASNLPGTTLLSIRIPCFESYKQAIWDTPGLFPKRYDWYRGSKPTMPAQPKILNPVVLDSYPQSHSVIFSIVGMPVRVEITLQDGGDTRRTLVWYSNHPVKPVTTSVCNAIESAPKNIIPNEVHIPSSQIDKPQASLISQCDLMEGDLPLFKAFSPAMERKYQSFSADIVFFDLGWLALSFNSPHNVKIYIPKSSTAAVRPVLFHPSEASSQQKFIDASTDNAATENSSVKSANNPIMKSSGVGSAYAKNGEKTIQKIVYIDNTVSPQRRQISNINLVGGKQKKKEAASVKQKYKRY